MSIYQILASLRSLNALIIAGDAACEAGAPLRTYVQALEQSYSALRALGVAKDEEMVDELEAELEGSAE